MEVESIRMQKGIRANEEVGHILEAWFPFGEDLPRWQKESEKGWLIVCCGLGSSNQSRNCYEHSEIHSTQSHGLPLGLDNWEDEEEQDEWNSNPVLIYTGCLIIWRVCRIEYYTREYGEHSDSQSPSRWNKNATHTSNMAYISLSDNSLGWNGCCLKTSICEEELLKSNLKKRLYPPCYCTTSVQNHNRRSNYLLRGKTQYISVHSGLFLQQI